MFWVGWHTDTLQSCHSVTAKKHHIVRYGASSSVALLSMSLLLNLLVCIYVCGDEGLIIWTRNIYPEFKMTVNDPMKLSVNAVSSIEA